MGAVDLYWLPLGAGGHFVRVNGRVYEALTARLHHRSARDPYHAALSIRTAAGAYVIEQAPSLGVDGERGIVAEGPVGARWAARFRMFRYEVHLWHEGQIPDIGEAVDSPRVLTDDETVAQRVADATKRVPTLVWGRDQLGTGEMWNSNSIIAWVLVQGGIDASSIAAPPGGRAPGWQAGVAVARRSHLGTGRV